jgi:striatin 1/3/4
MAWQSPSAIGAGNMGGNGGDGGNQVNQPQGTEYTLQGIGVKYKYLKATGGADMVGRGNALPPNRMAPARARPQCLGD